MADYFLSDTHLRLDRPDRAARLASVVDSFEPADRLFIGGDLCDYWFATRHEADEAFRQCAGLQSIAAFRERGGHFQMIVGNHDESLVESFKAWFPGCVIPEPLRVSSWGHEVCFTHGHLSGARSTWKKILGRRFVHHVFRNVPAFVAYQLDAWRQAANRKSELPRRRKFLAAYEAYVRSQTAKPNSIFLFGHIHHNLDVTVDSARMIVLDSWFHGTSYLRIDQQGVSLQGTSGINESAPTP